MHNCLFAKFVVQSPNQYSWHFCGPSWAYARQRNNVSHLTHMFPAEVERDEALPSCSHFLALNKCPFLGLLRAMFFPSLCFLLVILLFKIAPKSSAAVLSSVLKSKKVVVCLMEKIHALFRHEL